MDKLDDGGLRLRTGRSVWQADEKPVVESVRPREACMLETEIVIVGAGITGAFLAERFTRVGRKVVLIDRRAPVTGSTAASTALLLWELDSPLLEIDDRLGFEAAARIADICRRAVASIAGVVNEFGIDCGLRPRPSLYLSGDVLDAVQLKEEHRIRGAMGIEGKLLGAEELGSLGFIGDAALLYPGSAEADPVLLARGLIEVAIRRGAIVLSPSTASVYHAGLQGVVVETREGDRVHGATLVLANGYEMPAFVPAARHELVASWAVATARAAGPPWPDSALMWEASDPYLYARSTTDGRIVAGGEDEDFEDAETREARTEEKARAILKKLGERCPALAGLRAEFAWSGVFGTTDDALPMIGRVPGRVNCLAAFGYGGNGITFSAIAAEMLEAELEGRDHPGARLFALDRD